MGLIRDTPQDIYTAWKEVPSRTFPPKSISRRKMTTFVGTVLNEIICDSSLLDQLFLTLYSEAPDKHIDDGAVEVEDGL